MCQGLQSSPYAPLVAHLTIAAFEKEAISSPIVYISRHKESQGAGGLPSQVRLEQ